MPDPQFNTWRKLLALAAENKTKSRMRAAMVAEGVVILNGEHPSGYYRKQVNGKLEPAGIWRSGGQVCCFLGASDGKPIPAADLETMNGCAWMPVSREWYVNAVAGKGWPDVHQLPIDDEAERGIGDNSGASKDELAELADRIGTARVGLKKYVNGGIKDQTMLDASQSLRSQLNAMAGEVKKLWEERAYPLTVQLEALKKLFRPLQESAKDGADEIRFAQEEYATSLIRAREEERLKFEAEQRAANEQREAEAYAAQQAIDKGQEPPQPSFIREPEPPKPAAPITALKGGTGRAANVKAVEVIEHADVTNWLSLLDYLKDRRPVQDAALKEANKILRDFGEIPPGCNTRTKAKVT